MPRLDNCLTITKDAIIDRFHTNRNDHSTCHFSDLRG
jgi:hypothetical protein